MREPGYYWVKWDSEYIVAEWLIDEVDPPHCEVTGIDMDFKDDWFDSINENILIPPIL